MVLDAKFLTIEKTATFLGVAVEDIRGQIEQDWLFHHIALPAVPMVLVPSGHEETMRLVFEGHDLYKSFDLEKHTETRSGIFIISFDAARSLAIKGSWFINTVWTLSSEDYGYKDIEEGDPLWFGRRCYWLRNPVEVSLADIRIPMHVAKLIGEYNQLAEKAKMIEHSLSNRDVIPDNENKIHSDIAKKLGKKGAELRHASRNQWYTESVRKAAQLWENGKLLNHKQMADQLTQDAPDGMSKKTLMDQLKKYLKDTGRHHLVFGTRQREQEKT